MFDQEGSSKTGFFLIIILYGISLTRKMPTTDPPSPTDVGTGPGHCCTLTLGHTLLCRFPTFCDCSVPLSRLAATARFPVYISPKIIQRDWEFGYRLRMGPPDLP